MAHERIQYELAGQMQEARKDNDWKRLRGLKGLAKSVARLYVRGFFTPDVISNVGPTPERLPEITRFSDEEKRALKEDKALVYGLEGTTIAAQRELRTAEGKPSFYFVLDAGDRLVGRPSRLSEVAIYPQTDKFFIPGTENKDLATQERMVQKDADDLRKRLGQEGIDVVIPEEAATLTEVTFKHLEETGEWLFGKKYTRAHKLDFIYGRTKNPTNESGSHVAHVGGADPDDGLDVFDWHRGYGDDFLLAVRLVVPRETR